MLLAVDTSTAQLGLALYDGSQVIGELTCTSLARHTQELAPSVAALIDRCGRKPADLQALGVAIGPGSFTSLRVGLAFVKGLALARAIPVIPVPTLDIVAASIPPMQKKLAAVLQAGRGRLALVWYQASENGWIAQGPASVITADELEKKIHKPVIICGEMTPDDRHRLGRRYRNVTLASPAQCVRRPSLLAELAWQRWQSGEVSPVVSLAPIYLHTVGGPPG